MVFARIGRTWRTVRHLRRSQIAWLAYRRLVPLTAVAAPKPAEVRRRDGIGLRPRPCNARLGTDGGWTFTFLSRARTYTPSSVDWHPTDVPRLWRYNLHYFDYLLDDDCPLAARDALLEHWIAANPPGTRDAWEPYPTSLRIVNWIDFFLRTAAHRPPKPAWLRSLCHQAAWLERNVECHLLANHLLKNAVALVFAGAFFQGAAPKTTTSRNACGTQRNSSTIRPTPPPAHCAATRRPTCRPPAPASARVHSVRSRHPGSPPSRPR